MAGARREVGGVLKTKVSLPVPPFMMWEPVLPMKTSLPPPPFIVEAVAVLAMKDVIASSAIHAGRRYPSVIVTWAVALSVPSDAV